MVDKRYDSGTQDPITPLDSLDKVREALPEGVFDKVVENALAGLGVDLANGTYEVEYDRDEARFVFSLKDIQDWLDKLPVCDWMAGESIKHDLQGFSLYMTAKVEERSLWFSDVRWEMECRAAASVSNALERELASRGLGLALDEEELRDQVRELAILDRVFVDPDIEGVMGGWGDVDVDLLLMDGDEWNTDFTNISILSDTQIDAEAAYDWAVEEALSANGMSWLARQLGLRGDEMLTAEDSGSVGHEFWEELASVGAYGRPVMALFCSMSLEDWIRCVEAKEKGLPVTISGRSAVAGLYDPWSGSGGELGLEVPLPITIPAKNLITAALDGCGRRDGPRNTYGDAMLVSGEVYGYTLQTTYGIDRTLYRSASANAVVIERPSGHRL